MADFLSRLAGRALGVLPKAEPVIPVAFAPALSEAPASTGQESEAAAAAPLRTLERIEEAAAEMSEPVSGPASATTPKHPSTQEDRPIAEPQREVPAPPQVSQPGLRPHEPPRTDTPARPLRRLPARPPVAETPGLPAPEASSPLLQPGRRQQRMEQSTAQSAAPVRITIGRVEVRALMPAAAPEGRPRPEAPKGVLTLEEYTRQRRRGER